MKQNTIWIVEVQEENTIGWLPTVGIGLTRKEARGEKGNWEEFHPDDRFRIRPYVPRKGGKQ
uniref:Uncharacterized protein n=1 Tax=viral metagenome TaxID=1070528 RepID=A0A6M3JG70_9ZZZZ